MSRVPRYTDETLVAAGDKIRYHQAPGGLLPAGEWREGTAVTDPNLSGVGGTLIMEDDRGRRYNLLGHVIERLA